ncbi:hypothetical protein DFH09DRAFT_1076957 [Mycena vulgaris]|nr:hypothetical protein DFH09DRAFT_1076957 [Mycena vulgaris]
MSNNNSGKATILWIADFEGQGGVIRTAVLRCEMMMFREGGGEETEILVQIGAGRETECVNPPSRGFRGGFNVDKSWLYGDGVARYVLAVVDVYKVPTTAQQCVCVGSRFWQDSLTDQQDLGCGLIGSSFRARTRPNMDESSRVLSVSVLYPAGARWLSLRGQSARIQASLRAYPRGFPWVEPVSCKVRTVGGIQDIWGMCAKSRGIEFVRMLVALELYEIPREEVAGGAVGVVRGGFPWEGAQRSVTAALVREGIHRAYGTLTAAWPHQLWKDMHFTTSRHGPPPPQFRPLSAKPRRHPVNVPAQSLFNLFMSSNCDFSLDRMHPEPVAHLGPSRAAEYVIIPASIDDKLVCVPPFLVSPTAATVLSSQGMKADFLGIAGGATVNKWIMHAP